MSDYINLNGARMMPIKRSTPKELKRAFLNGICGKAPMCVVDRYMERDGAYVRIWHAEFGVN